jgi:hypothetical protein
MGQDDRQAGKSARAMGDRRLSSMIAWGIVGIVVILAIGYVMSQPSTFGVSGLGFFALLMLVVIVRNATEGRIDRKSKEARRAYRGAKAEERIEDILNRLDSENYAVFHDVPCAYGNIDHIVLSKQSGVFLIETKSHGGRVKVTDAGLLVNGHPPEKDFVAQALRNALWLRDQIKQVAEIEIWIKPIIVFANAFVEFGPPIKNVEVINKKFLLNKLQRNLRPNPLNEKLWAARKQIETLLRS